MPEPTGAYQPNVLCANGRIHLSLVPSGIDWVAGADRMYPECGPHRAATPEDPGVDAANCNNKPGRRDRDGHAWVGTRLGWPWMWRCIYCRARRRGELRPTRRTPGSGDDRG